MADPLSVKCPDCLAAPTIACSSRHLQPDESHPDRQRLADLRALEHGTCTLCGQWMVRGSVAGAPVDAWHPDQTDAAACPRLPNPLTDWNAYAETLTAGLTPGHPGVEHFQPAGEAADLNEQGRRLASERDDLIAAGADPADLLHGPGAAAALEDAYADGTLFNDHTPAVCPECASGKCVNCTTVTLDPVLEDFTPCTCTHGATRA